MTRALQKTYALSGQSGVWAPYGSNPNSLKPTVVFTETIGEATRPNWAYLISRGIDASNGYSHKGVSELRSAILSSGARYTWTDKRSYQCNTTTARYPLLFPIGTPSDVALQNTALARLRSRLATDANQFKGAVNIGELKELRGTIQSAADLGLQACQALLDLRALRLKSAAQRASDIWLTYSFGVSPLVSTIGDLSSSVGSYLARMGSEGITARYVGVAEKNWSSTDNFVYSPSHLGFGSVTAYTEYRHRLLYKYSAGYKMFPSASNQYGGVEHFGLGLSSLPSVGWELLPFSWVADYFTNVGAFLEDTFESPSGNTFYCTLSKLYECEASFTLGELIPTKTTSPYFFRDQWSGSSPGSSKSYDFTRTVLSQLPHMQLRVKSLDEIGNHAVNKLLNLTAVGIGGRKFS